MAFQRRSEKSEQATKTILKSLLTWSHVLTVSILMLAALHNIGGLIAIILRKDLADPIIRYTETWRSFFIAGILGYDAKSTVENVTKIGNSIKELQENTEKEPDNG